MTDGQDPRTVADGACKYRDGKKVSNFRSNRCTRLTDSHLSAITVEISLLRR